MMPTYVYGCTKHIQEHPRLEIQHGMTENPVLCCEVCGSKMRRIPQGGMTIMFNPGEILLDWMTENYNRYRARSKGKNAPSFSPDEVNRPDGIPGKNGHKRRKR